MYSEPTISPTFVVRQKRKMLRNPLVLGGLIAIILVVLSGILSLLTSLAATPAEPEPHIHLKSMLIVESTPEVEPTVAPDLVINTSAFTPSEPANTVENTVSSQTVERKPRCQITTTGDTNVNIRSGPDVSFSLISSLSNRNTVNAIAASDNRWFQILNTDGTIGCVGGSVVDETGDCTDLSTIATPVCSVKNTTGNRVNIRDRANTNSNVIRTLSVDDMLMADGRTSDGWYRILLTGELGWIYQDVVALSDACTQTAVISANEPTPEPALNDTPIVFNSDDCVVESFTGSTIDLREGPGMEFAVVAKMSKAMVANRLSSNGWYEIDRFGWAFAGDLVYGGLCNLLPTVQPDQIRGAIAVLSSG